MKLNPDEIIPTIIIGIIIIGSVLMAISAVQDWIDNPPKKHKNGIKARNKDH